jgi:hypothetical protein
MDQGQSLNKPHHQLVAVAAVAEIAHGRRSSLTQIAQQRLIDEIVEARGRGVRNDGLNVLDLNPGPSIGVKDELGDFASRALPVGAEQFEQRCSGVRRDSKACLGNLSIDNLS